jgi:glycosyltransferase involved in cell wall biosynthesis
MGTYRLKGDVVAMPSTVDKAVFHSRNRDDCRAALNLPREAVLIGTAGGLYRAKGIEDLYAAWNALCEDAPNFHLVLAGPYDPALPPPEGKRVHYLGAMPHDQIAKLFCALDVGAICVLDTPFGRYSFPQKAYEMLACGLPVVAAGVGAMGTLFAEVPRSLYVSGDANDLAGKLLCQAAHPTRANFEIEDWKQVVTRVESRLLQLAKNGRHATTKADDLSPKVDDLSRN